MRNYSQFPESLLCKTCNQERDVIKIIIDYQASQSTLFELSCGHSIKKITIRDSGVGSDQLKIDRFSENRKLLSKSRTKISGRTRKEAREIIVIDRKRGVKIHRVEEQNEQGEYKTVHYHEDPLKNKG